MSESYFQPVVQCVWSPRLLAYLLEESCIVLSDTSSLEAGVPG